MTIGLCAFGPRAGAAALAALAAVERVSWGSIGGFCAFAAIDAQGRLHRAETQRGGTRTLFPDGERTDAPPHEALAEARFVGLISSGPDRPAPLAAFLAADPTVGLVSGHRLPAARGLDGRPINAAVLAAMAAGRTPQQAVDGILADNPAADVGLIALDLSGALYAANAERVAARDDLGHARREGRGGACVEVLHNAIRPGPAVAAVAAEVALATMVPHDSSAAWLEVTAGLPVELGARPEVHVDGSGAAVRAVTPDATLLRGGANGAALYYGAAVLRDGAEIGVLLDEPNVTLDDGRIVAMSGQARVRLRYRPVRPG